MAELRLPKQDYRFETLAEMAHRLGHFFSISIESEDQFWRLTWKESGESAQESEDRVRNEIYEQIIRDRVYSETKPIRDLIFAAAFSSLEIK